MNGVGLNKETDEKHDEDCVEEKFQSARIKCDRDGEGVREPLGTPNQGVNIWDGSELALALFKKSSSYFENNSLIFLDWVFLHYFFYIE